MGGFVMKKCFKIFCAILLVVNVLVAKAQNDGVTLTMLPHLPYTNYFNPGIRTPYNGVIGVGVSNMGYSIINSSINYKNIYVKDANGNDAIDGLKLFNSLDDFDNVINWNLSFDVLKAGFRINKLFVDIDCRMRINTEMSYSKDFVGLFVLGNGHYLGKDNPCNFSCGMDASAYYELGMGFQYDINEHLTVGVRPKFLLGVANVVLNNNKTKIYTDADSYAISADIGFDVKASSNIDMPLERVSDIVGFIDYESMQIGDFLNVKGNYGFGADLGAAYVFNRHFGVSAAVRDLGFITWKNAKVKQCYKNDVMVNEAVFSELNQVTDVGVDYKTMLDNVIDNVWGNDTLVDGDAYKTTLKTKMMLQGYYEYNPMLRVTAIGQMCYINNKMLPAVTLAYSGSFLNCIDVTVSWMHSQYSGSTIGAGLGFHFGPVNLFAVTDNIMVLTKQAAPMIELSTSYQAVNMRVGVVFTIGKYQGSKKMVAVKTDVIDTEAIDREKEEFDQ